MTNMLAQRKGEWFLEAFAPHLQGCNLSTLKKPRNDAERFHLWQQRSWVWSHAPLADVTFYPEIRYQGRKVYPEAWHMDGEEMVLRCHMMGDQVGTEYARCLRELEEDGWEWRAGEGGTRNVRLDDLEKREGLPPLPAGIQAPPA